MSVIRWVFQDLKTSETYTFRINPNTSTSPRRVKELSHGMRLDRAATTFMSSPSPPQWTFGGVIRSKEQHDELLYWSRKKGALRVTDHMGQTFEILIQAFRPSERQRTALVAWRMTYEMQTIILRRIA